MGRIVKTRRLYKLTGMAKLSFGDTRGILNPQTGEQKFSLSRPEPSPDLKFFVQHYWMVEWDLRGQNPYMSETLPFPSVQIVIEENRPEVYGVMKTKFSRCLQERGRAFGIKFRPAAFYPFFGHSLSTLTDRVVSLRSIFGEEGASLKEAILGEQDEDQCVAHAESFLRARLPRESPAIKNIRDAVERISVDNTITRAEQVASHAGVTLRSLQRRFSRYVGVSPKWVIQRYRLQEAADRLAFDKTVTTTDMALELGYFDQAHFIRDFKKMMGESPGAYVGRVHPKMD